MLSMRIAPPAKGFRLALFILPVLIFSFLFPYPSQVARAMDAPTLVAPADGAEVTATGVNGTLAAPPLAIPTFQWNPVPEATSYRIQFSQDIAFTKKFEATTALTTYTPLKSSLFNDGVWYWRVRVEKPEASFYSDTFEFTRTWASEDNFPELLQPEDGATLEFYDEPVFSWSPVLGAASYIFQISLSSDFTTLAWNASTLVTTYQPTKKLSNAIPYYWRVIPLDPNDREGTYSQVQTFSQLYSQIPVQLEPADFSTPTFTPTFHWTAVRGAQTYQLQYSTDPSFMSEVTTVKTANTTYTPLTTMENDVNVYWRVKTLSGDSASEWSPVRRFMKKWYMKPVLLTPTNLYQYNRFPFFSWTPVPGARYYRIDIAYDVSFTNIYITDETANTFYTPDKWTGAAETIYWRVTPFDGSKFIGVESDTFSFRKSVEFDSPTLVYPLYYYPPSTFPPPDDNVVLNPHEDRTVPYPIFIWNRLTDFPDGQIIATYYRLEVSTNPNFTSVAWSVDTENQYAAPMTASDFNPLPGTDYYWRVGALNSSHNLTGEWSQVWKARFDSSKGLPPTSGASPALLRPARGSEIVEATPVFEWQPYSGADSYEVRISPDGAFGSLLMEATVDIPAFAPLESIAQRNLNKLNYSTYYWAVRAHTSSGWTDWSSPWRFQIASQSQWLQYRAFGDSQNRLQVASDPAGGSAIYDLTKLYASQDDAGWYFGFNANKAGADANFMLYLDMDHKDGSGAASAPAGYGSNIATIPAHQPEFALLVKKIGNNFSADEVEVYAWTGSAWDFPDILSDIGGDLYLESLSPPSGDPYYVELFVPNTAIGMAADTGSYALSLLSLPVSPGAPQDSVPADPNVPGSGPISRFASASNKENTLYPFNNIEYENVDDDPGYPSVPPFFWENPLGEYGTSPWAGAGMEVHLDEEFTSKVAEYFSKSTAPYYAPTSHAWEDDLIGDNSYFWRLRPRYLTPDAMGEAAAAPQLVEPANPEAEIYGAWSQGWRFERRGFIATNMQESVTFATPTFTWDIAEGAQSYDLQVDDDPVFKTPNISANTTQNTFTTVGTLPNGTYYWRLLIKRDGGVDNDWSDPKEFTVSLPQPTGLTPHDPDAIHVIGGTPTYCWDTLIKDDDSGIPTLAAYKYRLEVSRGDPTFSRLYDSIDTEQSCYTPRNGYQDGTYYWHVAMIDGPGKVGDFSDTAVFTKQYPVTELVSPVGGSSSTTPTFVWTPVAGAAAYKLEISQTPTFAPLYENITTNQITYTPAKIYMTNATYYWRVAIIDLDKNLGPFNDATIILGSGFRTYLPMTIRN